MNPSDHTSVEDFESEEEGKGVSKVTMREDNDYEDYPPDEETNSRRRKVSKHASDCVTGIIS